MVASESTRYVVFDIIGKLVTHSSGNYNMLQLPQITAQCFSSQFLRCPYRSNLTSNSTRSVCQHSVSDAVINTLLDSFRLLSSPTGSFSSSLHPVRSISRRSSSNGSCMIQSPMPERIVENRQVLIVMSYVQGHVQKLMTCGVSAFHDSEI